MSAHTPGPWKATTQTVTAPETDDRSPLDVRLYGGNRKDHAANARLIAAAPELLTWLRWSLKHLSDDKKQSGQYDMACAVIFKATGATP